MTWGNIILAFLFLCGNAFCLHGFDLPATIQHRLPDYLPKNNEIQGWQRDGPPQEYRGDELYEYINGGAEIYHEYGFRQVLVQDFKNRNERSISLEIFEMEDAESAYGIYTFKTGPEDRMLSLESDARLSDYYLNFWKGNLLVTITGFDEETETINALQEMARLLDQKIKGREERPRLASVLPEDGLKPSSIKYFQGNLGLYNSYPFVTRDVFSLEEGIKGDYEGGRSVFVIESRSGKDGESVRDEIEKSFVESPRYRNYERLEKDIFKIEDRKETQIFVSFFQNWTFIVMGDVDLVQVRKCFSSIQENIDNIGK